MNIGTLKANAEGVHIGRITTLTFSATVALRAFESTNERAPKALRYAGVDEGVRQAHAPGEAASRRAAALMAQKRRLGPWARERGEGDNPLAVRKVHEKAVAAMLRAGHQYDHVRFVLAARAPEDVDQWLGEAADDEEGIDSLW